MFSSLLPISLLSGPFRSVSAVSGDFMGFDPWPGGSAAVALTLSVQQRSALLNLNNQCSVCGVVGPNRRGPSPGSNHQLLPPE